MRKRIAIALCLVMILTLALAMVGCGAKTTQYTVTFKNGDTVVQTGKVDADAVIVAPATNPTKPADAENTYTFAGWYNGDVKFEAGTKATADVTYTAKFDATPIEPEVETVTITFVNGETTVATNTVEVGAAIVAPAAPTKAADEDNTYVFDGWYIGEDKLAEGAVASVDATYTAKFTAVAKIVITFKVDGEDDVVVKFGAGEAIVLPAAPSKAPTEDEMFAFDGWYNGETKLEAGTTATADATYTAKFTASPIVKYTVTFVNGEDSTTAIVVEGQKIGDALADDAEKAGFIFAGWYVDGVQMTADTVINADVTASAAFACEDGHRFICAPVAADGKVIIACADCDMAATYNNVAGLVRTQENGASLVFDTGKPIAGTLEEDENGNHYIKMYRDVPVDPATGTQFQTIRGNGLPTTAAEGYFTIKMRGYELNDTPVGTNPGAFLELIITNSAGNWTAVEDGEGNSVNNNANGAYPVCVWGNEVRLGHRGNGAILGRISTTEFTELGFAYALDFTAKTMTVDFFIDGEYVYTWVRTNIALTTVTGFYFNGNMYAVGTGYDMDDFIVSSKAPVSVSFAEKTVPAANHLVVFKDAEGKVITSGIFAEGEDITFPADLTKAEDNFFTYTFAGWYNGEEKWTEESVLSEAVVLQGKFTATAKKLSDDTTDLDAADVDADSLLLTLNAKKIKGMADTTAPHYVTLAKGEDTVQALYFASAENNTAFGEIRFTVGQSESGYVDETWELKKVIRISFDYRLYNANEETFSSTESAGPNIEDVLDLLQVMIYDDTMANNTDYLGKRLDMVADGQWHNYTITFDTAIEKYQGFIIKINKFAGELIVANVEVEEAPAVIYTVDFKNGDETVETKEVYEGKPVVAPADPTKAGSDTVEYIFDGWYTDLEDESTKLTAETVATADATYIAKFNAVPKYAITFKAEGKDDVVVRVLEGAEISVPADAVKAPTAEKDYIFKGWFNGETKLVAGAVASADVTYTAVFDEVDHIHKLTSPAVDLTNNIATYTCSACGEVAGRYFIYVANEPSIKQSNLAKAYTMDDTAHTLILGSGGTWHQYADDDDVITMKITEEDGNKFMAFRASGTRSGSTQIQNSRTNTVLFDGLSGIFTIQMRGQAANDVGTKSDMQISLTTGGAWGDYEDDAGVKNMNSTNASGLLHISGNTVYDTRVSKIGTLSDTEWTTLTVKFTVAPATLKDGKPDVWGSTTLEYYVNGVLVETLVRNHTALASVKGIYFNGNLKGAGQGYDIDNVVISGSAAVPDYSAPAEAPAKLFQYTAWDETDAGDTHSCLNYVAADDDGSALTIADGKATITYAAGISKVLDHAAWVTGAGVSADKIVTVPGVGSGWAADNLIFTVTIGRDGAAALPKMDINWKTDGWKSTNIIGLRNGNQITALANNVGTVIATLGEGESANIAVAYRISAAGTIVDYYVNGALKVSVINTANTAHLTNQQWKVAADAVGSTPCAYTVDNLGTWDGRLDAGNVADFFTAAFGA